MLMAKEACPCTISKGNLNFDSLRTLQQSFLTFFIETEPCTEVYCAFGNTTVRLLVQVFIKNREGEKWWALHKLLRLETLSFKSTCSDQPEHVLRFHSMKTAILYQCLGEGEYHLEVTIPQHVKDDNLIVINPFVSVSTHA